MNTITSVCVRMYKMGTGDCFVLKFYSGTRVTFKMMIDCGTWSGSREKLEEYISDLKNYVDNHVHVLVVTHEHKDHVHGFDACKDMLTAGFKVDRIWMGWTEDDKSTKVKKWQKEFGNKKKALAVASTRLKQALDKPEQQNEWRTEFNGMKSLASRQRFAGALHELSELHSNIDGGDYVGGLAGMMVVKDLIADQNIEYYNPGDIIEGAPEMEGVRFYVLGPPKKWDKEINVQEGGKGESYDHNKELAENDAFAAAALVLTTHDAQLMPFHHSFLPANANNSASGAYNADDANWRKIDTEWLNSAGSMALRINSITNNLSLAFAIEFENSGKVMLFPGDAEYGSWASWHNIPWDVPCRNGKPHFTEDLLSRTVFYKVAHHLSHHGTAERLGMNMMTDPGLVAMATLDYETISKNWKNTMPNKALLKDLIIKTKGRLLVMNDAGLTTDLRGQTPLKDKLKEARKKMTKKEQQDFKHATINKPLYVEYTLYV